MFIADFCPGSGESQPAADLVQEGNLGLIRAGPRTRTERRIIQALGHPSPSARSATETT
jgi:hypothetical protein